MYPEHVEGNPFLIAVHRRLTTLAALAQGCPDEWGPLKRLTVSALSLPGDSYSSANDWHSDNIGREPVRIASHELVTIRLVELRFFVIIQPRVMIAPPRFWEAMCSDYQIKIADSGLVKRLATRAALALGDTPIITLFACPG